MGEEIYINILNNEIQLDERCWNCGKGKAQDKTFTDKNGVCEICNGTKFVPTMTGDALLRFLRRHLDK